MDEATLNAQKQPLRSVYMALYALFVYGGVFTFPETMLGVGNCSVHICIYSDQNTTPKKPLGKKVQNISGYMLTQCNCL